MKRRTVTIVAIVLLAIVVAAVGGYFLTRDTNKVPTVGAIVQGPPGAVDVQTLLGSIP